MHEELLQFKKLNVWRMVKNPKNKRPIGAKWVFKNKNDDKGVIIRNKAKLVVQGFSQREGLDYNEVYAPVVRLEAIRIFLAYASYMNFKVYQMYTKTDFLYGNVKKEIMSINCQVLRIQIIRTTFNNLTKLSIAFIKHPALGMLLWQNIY
ncbi:putative mitochondrial protein AtMg00820 [Bidens hawaiensis]|uniref:putative mitochondrial protein AtMg00820 n=1 Tax=Bidens hawaiensis TaxID=980011 RepID=UPI00404B6497